VGVKFQLRLLTALKLAAVDLNTVGEVSRASLQAAPRAAEQR
jgi:hypothetical protein